MRKWLQYCDGKLPSLLALAIRIIFISVAPHKVAKESTSVSLSRVIVAGIIALATFAFVNTTL